VHFGGRSTVPLLKKRCRLLKNKRGGDLDRGMRDTMDLSAIKSYQKKESRRTDVLHDGLRQHRIETGEGSMRFTRLDKMHKELEVVSREGGRSLPRGKGSGGSEGGKSL